MDAASKAKGTDLPYMRAVLNGPPLQSSTTDPGQKPKQPQLAATGSSVPFALGIVALHEVIYRQGPPAQRPAQVSHNIVFLGQMRCNLLKLGQRRPGTLDLGNRMVIKLAEQPPDVVICRFHRCRGS